MSHDDILAICKDFYGESDVAEAKSLMYNKFKCPERAKIHRGAAKKINDIKEIISFLSQNVLSEVIFCITKCTQVPSVSMEFIDASAMNRHISTLRMEMTMMSAASRRLAAKIEEIEANVQQQLSQNHLSQEVNMDIPANIPTTSYNTGKATAAEIVRRKPPSVRNFEANRKKSGNNTHPHDEAGDATSSESTTEEEQWLIPKHQFKKMKRSSQPKRYKSANNDVMDGRRNTGQLSRRRQAPVIGKGEGTLLKAAQPLRDVSLFVSRLQPDVTSDVLQGHVSHLAGVTTVECEQVHQRHSHYRSYKVIINAMPRDKIKELYKPESWIETSL